MRKSRIHLGDGRELIYFDERDDVTREPTDLRHIGSSRDTGEIRYDATVDEWVVVAPHRQTRTHLPGRSDCPLCPSTGGRITEIPSTSYDVVVFENRFPSFSAASGGASMAVEPRDILARRAASGRCEVVCFTAEHDTSFLRLTNARVRTVIDVWADRTIELSEIPGIEQVFCFENRGEEIGVTLHHPHGQIYGYPFVAPQTNRMLAAARVHRNSTGRNLFSDVLVAEREADERIVIKGDYWTAFVPSAARWPFEVHMYPHRHVPDIPALTREERDELAIHYVELLARLDSVFGVAMPYVAAWHQAPVRTGRELAYLHLRLHSPRRAVDKIKYLAGSEAAMGAFINDVPPEAAAEMLRAVDPNTACA